MDYFTHTARQAQPSKPDSTERRETRDAYQMHAQRYTREQIETATRVASGLRFA